MLGSEITGLIMAVNGEPQDYVAAGETLIQLDSGTTELELKALEARRDLSTVMDDARIKLEYARDNLNIVKELYEKMIGESALALPKNSNRPSRRSI